jgi:hypothetical protein
MSPFVPPKPHEVAMFKTPEPGGYQKMFNEIDEYDEDDWEEATVDETLMESLMESFKGILDGGTSQS